MRRYSDEERAALKAIIPGRSYAEIIDLHEETYRPRLTRAQLVAFIKNNGVTTGRTGRFEKGRESHNKGRKGWFAPGTEATRFPKGSVPHNRVPLGTEKVRADGYVWVKVQDGCKNANWKQKHVLVWEAANGPVPPRHVVMLAAGDPQNCVLDNLLLATKTDLCRFNKMKLGRESREVTEAGLLVARMHNAIGAAKRRSRR